MRLYHFLSAKDAMEDLTNWRIKISLIDELNDPFELWCVAQDTPQKRRAMKEYKATMADRYGLLCFCQDWHNPVLWSHYADRHRGICLGFDVADGVVTAVEYVRSRLPLEFPPTEERSKRLLYTKYWDWSYEHEYRAWVEIGTADPASGHYFYGFDEKVSLRAVFAGPLCTTRKADIRSAMAQRGAAVDVIQTRLAFLDFRVVENLGGFRRLA